MPNETTGAAASGFEATIQNQAFDFQNSDSGNYGSGVPGTRNVTIQQAVCKIQVPPGMQKRKFYAWGYSNVAGDAVVRAQVIFFLGGTRLPGAFPIEVGFSGTAAVARSIFLS